MNSLTARWIYCAGLFLVAACAVLPSDKIAAPEAVAAVTEAAPTPEQQLARVIRERIELSGTYSARHPAMVRAAASEETLRGFAARANPDHFHRDLIRALANELTDALADRRAAPELASNEAAVSGLLAAINVEMRRRDI